MRTALILSGGGTKGAIEAGACRVLLKSIKPDLIIGTSVGALNAAFLAKGPDMEENSRKLEKLWLQAGKKSFFQLNRKFLYRLTKAGSVFTNKGIYDFLNEHFSGMRFEDLETPLYINCTNLTTGMPEFFSSGDLIDPLVASSSAIPLLPPVDINGIPYVDGALGSVLGVEIAFKLRCRRVVIIDVEMTRQYDFQFRSIREYVDYAWSLMKNQSIRNEIRLCKEKKISLIHIIPPTYTHAIVPTKFAGVDEMIKAGEEAAARCLNSQRKKLS